MPLAALNKYESLLSLIVAISQYATSLIPGINQYATLLARLLAINHQISAIKMYMKLNNIIASNKK